MSVQFFGLLTHEYSSETIPRAKDAPVMDINYMVKVAQAHEAAGFDRVLIAHHSANPDGIMLASYIAQHTTNLNFMIAHRPGFISPTYAARMWATFDQLYGGRAGIHVISGGSDADQKADGDWLDHGERYRRTDDWLEVFRKTMTSDAPFSLENFSFKVENAISKIKPKQKPYPPIFFGGASADAIRVGARHADYWALYGEPLAETRQMIEAIRNAAVEAGRDASAIKFALTLRPVIGKTEEEAWQKADNIVARIKELRGGQDAGAGAKPQAESSRRLRDIASAGKVQDVRLWTEVAALTGGGSNSTGLVGTADQVAQAMEAYYDLGVSIFMLRGFDPLVDAQEYGSELIPAVHARIAARAEKVGETV